MADDEIAVVSNELLGKLHWVYLIHRYKIGCSCGEIESRKNIPDCLVCRNDER